MSPPTDGVKLVEALRSFSPAAARIVEVRPRLARFAEGRVPFDGHPADVLARVPLDEARVRRAVRLLRARVFVHTAAAEMHGASPLDTARLWSDAADAAISLCARLAAADTEAKLGAAVVDGEPVGRAIFALGKLGSRELNPSSDVDLLFAYARDGALASGASAHEWHVHFARGVRSLLHDVDDDGFAFRVDLDLRPEGSAGPLTNSVDALESYYERFGQTWERAALLRLRAVVDEGAPRGAEGVAAQVDKRLRPFVFPRSVDERAVDELFAMKHRVTASATADGFDVKRGRGGIREVEFVVQAHQLLHGGKVPDLREGSTVELLERLEARGFLAHKTVADLRAGYVLLRRVEHALQYGEDRQTQILPEAGAEHDRVAAAVARAAALRRPFDDVLTRTRARVHATFSRLLGEDRDAPSAEARRALDRTEPDAARTAALAALGFEDAARAFTLVRVLERRRGSPFAPEQARAVTVTPAETAQAAAHLLDHVAKSPDPMSALARLPDLFLERVPRASLSRLTHDRRTLALATRLLATSAPLSRLLARHHGLDEILTRPPPPSRLRRGQVRADLAAERAPQRTRAPAGAVDDVEQALVALRRVHGRRTLSVALSFFAGAADVSTAQLSLSALADGLLDEAVALAAERIDARHGRIAGMRFAVLALGSLGGREVGFFRDLDLFFVYDGAAADDESDGPRPVGAGEMAARTAQQVIWALSAPLAEGACYEVDPRLRPSGSQGALTTSLATFVDYHRRASAPWEKQALLRARFVAGDPDLGRAAVAAARRAALDAPPPAGLGARLLDMRARMVAERASPHGLDLKMGEGGLADVEFAVQGLQLAHRVWCPSTRRALRHLARRGHLAVATARALEDAWMELQTAREALALVDDRRAPAVTAGDARLDLLTRAGVIPGPGGAALYDRLAQAAATIRELSGRILLRLG